MGEMNLKNVVKDYKTYIALGVICAAVLGFTKLPGQVATLAEEVEKNETAVQQLAQTVDKYIAVQNATQAEKAKADEKKEELLLKLIEQMVNKDGE